MEQFQNTWNIVCKHFMVLYDVFVASLGLNNNTEYYKLKSTGSDLDWVWSDRYPIRRKWLDQSRYRSSVSDRCIPSQKTRADQGMRMEPAGRKGQCRPAGQTSRPQHTEPPGISRVQPGQYLDGRPPGKTRFAAGRGISETSRGCSPCGLCES